MHSPKVLHHPIMTTFLFLVIFLLACTSSVNAAPNTAQNAAWNVNMSSDGTNPAGYYGNWTGHAYYPSPNDWRTVSIYQFITDRFRDGDPTNNEGKYGGYNLYRADMRHGGDFKGISDSIDYIKTLGYNAIWISPIFQNRTNNYHGYAQTDFTLLDDRFGTLSDFRDMVNVAHSKGVYVIVDIVVNHMDNLLYFDGYQNASAPFKMHAGEYKLYYRNSNELYADFWVNNNFYSAGLYTDVYNWDGTKVTDSNLGTGSFWDSDFHHNGDLGDYGNPWQNHLGKIYGVMDDLRTSHPRVQDKIIAMTKSLIGSTDIDGIRMDTPMQVPLGFFKRWIPAVKTYAKTLGKNNFFIYGEFYCDRKRGATMVGRGKDATMYNNQNAFIDNTFAMDGGINYALYFSFFQDAIKNQSPFKLTQIKTQYDEDLKSYDWWNPSANEMRYEMVNFFNNHDQWRMSYATDGQAKTNLSSAIIAFWPGIPLYYYGDEQGFNSEGTALDGWSREDFMTSLAWYNVKTKTGAINPAIQDNFNMTNPIYLWVQKIMNVRRQYPALQTADSIIDRWQQASANPGIYAYTRIYGTQKEWAFVAFNTWSGPLEAGGSLGTLTTGFNAGDVIVNVLNPSEKYTLGTGGKINSLVVEPYSIKVFIRADNVKVLDPVVTNVTPSHDTRITTSATQINITFSETMDETSVKNAFNYDGKSVDPALLNYQPSTKTLTYSPLSIEDGIHKITILDTATSQVGKKMNGSFISRFRKGSEMNPIANAQLSWIRNNNLINNGAITSSGMNVKLYHDAAGATKFRVSNDGGSTWSSWQPYQPVTDWTMSYTGLNQLVVVQYWADGSAAYFTDDVINVGEIPAQNYSLTLYYKALWTTNASFFHYRPVGGAWSVAPGKPMSSSAFPGYWTITVDLGSNNGIAESAFNNGAGIWDNNNSLNYSFTPGIFTLNGNTITPGTPEIDTIAPSIPTNVTSTGVSATSVSLSWTVSTDNVGVSSYDIYRNGNKIGSSLTNSYTDPTVSASTNYIYTIKANDVSGNSSTESVACSITTPSVPVVTSNKITIYYKPSWTGTNTYIHFAPTGGSWTVAPGKVMSLSTYSGYYTITLDIGSATGITAAFTNGSTWENNNSKNYSIAVGTFTISTGIVTIGTPTLDTIAPTTATNVTTSALTSSSLNLSWSAATDNMAVTGYDVYRNGVKIGSTPGLTFSDASLAASTNYTYTIKAFDAAGNYSVDSSLLNITTLAAPITISNKITIYYKSAWTGNITNIHYAPLGGSWTVAPGKSMSASSFSGYYTITLDIGSATGITAAFNNGNTWENNNSKNYSISVGTFTIAPGVVTSGTPVLDTNAPSVPNNLASTSLTSSSVGITWTASTDNVAIAGYDVYRNGVKVGSTISTSFNDTALTATTNYTYTIKAFDIAGNYSADSVALTIKTLTTPIVGSNKLTIYYKPTWTGSVTNIHYAPLGGSWTTAPGKAMSISSFAGYFTITLDIGSSTGITATFNNGNTWDNNNSKNFSISAGTVSISSGVIKTGTP